MVKRIVTIAGLSCVGKGTLIDRLAKEDKDFNLRLGVVGTPGFFASRSATRSGKTLYRSVEHMFASPEVDTVVFRWQIKGDSIIEQLSEAFPEASSLILLLWRPWKQVAANARQVHGGHRTAESERRMWKKHIAPSFGPSSRRFSSVRLLDGEYHTIDWGDIE